MNRWVSLGYNPAAGIKSLKVPRNTIQIFQPDELKEMLTRLEKLAPQLCAAIALWAFAGIRLEEIGRMSWPQINQALSTGVIELQGSQTKTQEPRNVALELSYDIGGVKTTKNLRIWLMKYQCGDGSILPLRWLQPTKIRDNKLGELPRFIRRKTGLPWPANGPRHSFGTFFFKLCKDPGYVVRVMGHDLAKFQKYYWNKSDLVTEQAASEYFAIMPSPTTNF